MAVSDRIHDLRRRVLEDPASIAFAQLAEEHRRAGELAEAVEACRTGLAIHPDYASARITLGRSLLALGRLDDAVSELTTALESAPDNLAGVRALAEARRRQGSLDEALSHYRAAQALAPGDPDLERIVNDISHTLDAARAREAAAAQSHASATIAALEQWLEAIHATRANRDA